MLPISNALSMKSNSNLTDKSHASYIALVNSEVLSSGYSSNNVLNNQHPAFECNDSSRTLQATIWPVPFIKLRN